ncbi:MAG: hypothetical protein ACE5HE_02925 [Phycisphaerae bacterium]
MASDTADYGESVACEESMQLSAGYREAIAESFYEDPDALDIRPLWAAELSSYFRVNFWHMDRSAREERIYRSAFVAVEITAGGLRVADLTERAAA